MTNKTPSAKKNADIDFLQQLSDWMHTADIHEISFENKELNVHVVRRGNVVAPAQIATMTMPAPSPVAAAEAAQATDAVDQGSNAGHVERAPMVGVAYLAPSPNDDDFVSVGQSVRVGDPLMIIEAMKVMNQIQATKAGIIKEILVKNGEPIEFEQPLVRLD